MPSETMDLFSRAPRPHNKAPEVIEITTEKSDNTAVSDVETDDHRVQQMIGNAFLLLYSVDEWMDSKTMPVTFRLNSSRGELYMTKNRRVAANLATAGRVVFTPLEVEQLIRADKQDKLRRAERLERGEEEGEASINEALIDRIYDMKKFFPGCKLDEILLTTSEEEK